MCNVENGKINGIRITLTLIVVHFGIYPIQWSIDSLDWQESATKESICQRVEERMHNGAIVLFHNNGTFTAEALKEILRIGTEKGYEFVPIGELIYKTEDYKVDVQGGQSK